MNSEERKAALSHANLVVMLADEAIKRGEENLPLQVIRVNRALIAAEAECERLRKIEKAVRIFVADEMAGKVYGADNAWHGLMRTLEETAP